MADFMIYWVQENALATAALAVLVALVCRITRRRPAVEHALWVLVLVKLLMPPLVEWPREWRGAVAAVVASLPVPREAWQAPDERRQNVPAAPVSDATIRITVDPGPPLLEELALAVVADGAVDPALDDAPDSLPLLVERSFEIAAVDPVTASGMSPTTGTTAPPEGELDEAAIAGESSTDPVPADARWSAALRVWLPRAGLGGGVLFLLLNLLAILRFTRTLGTARPASPELRLEVESLASRLGMRAPRTLVVPGAGSPLAWGLGRPTLLLPAELVGRFRHETWRGILLHELAHLRRRDHYVGCLLVAAQCIWWWNPVFWYVRRRLGESAELACDAWVVWAAPDGRREYAESLLDVARSMSREAGRSSPLPLTTLFTTRTGRAARREFERRLTMIMTATCSRRVSRLGAWTIVLLAALTVPAWSLGQGLGAGAGEASATGEEAPADEGVDGVDLEVTEESVVDLSEPVVIDELVDEADEALIEVPAIRFEAVEDVRAPGQVVIVQEGAGVAGQPLQVVVPQLGGAEAPNVPGVRFSLAGDDRAMGADDRRMEQIERDIQKLERSLAAVLSELRSLRRDRILRGDPGDSGLDAGTDLPGRHRTSTSRRSELRSLVDPRTSTSGRSRAGSAAAGPAAPRVSRSLGGVQWRRFGTDESAPRSGGPARTPGTSRADSALADAPAADESSDDYSLTVRTLTRATYRLPEGKARALAEFLRENVEAEMEIEAKGDTLTVTTSGDSQKTIEGLIDLLMSKSARRDRRRGS